jgi:hypothetical protein
MVPYELRLVAVWSGGTRAHERAMHAALSRCRVKGEWFRSEPDCLRLIGIWTKSGPPGDDGDGRPPPSPTRRQPTLRQLEVFNFVADEIERRGFAPSIREIGIALDIGSTNGVNDHLRALFARDMLERPEDNTARGMRLGPRAKLYRRVEAA